MNALLVVDGAETALTTRELRAALKAIVGMRKGAKIKMRDIWAYEFYEQGFSFAEIGRMLSITARSAKSAVERVKNGRYGNVVIEDL